jgi:purine-binding chemotaxis protein CheW
MKVTRRAGEIDWSAIHERLEQAAATTTSSFELAPERAKEVMERRARKLAQVPNRILPVAEVLESVTFALANESYGIETRYVREVIRLTDFTPVPAAPDFLLGVTNLRGEILAVVDLRKFFGITLKGLTDLSRVVVLGKEQAEFGVLADSIQGATIVRVDELVEPPASVSGISREYVRGITAQALVLLDAAVLLKDTRFFIDQRSDSGI